MGVATTYVNEPFNRGSVSSELAPYWPPRIEHDRLWYRNPAVEAERLSIVFTIPPWMEKVQRGSREDARI